MRHRFMLPALLALGLCLTGFAPPQDATGGSGADIEVPAAASMGAADGSDAPAATISASPPQRAALPRTMRAHWAVFAFFALSWVGITVYLLRLDARAGRLAERLAKGEVPS